MSSLPPKSSDQQKYSTIEFFFVKGSSQDPSFGPQDARYKLACVTEIQHMEQHHLATVLCDKLGQGTLL